MRSFSIDQLYSTIYSAQLFSIQSIARDGDKEISGFATRLCDVTMSLSLFLMEEVNQFFYTLRSAAEVDRQVKHFTYL